MQHCVDKVKALVENGEGKGGRIRGVGNACWVARQQVPGRVTHFPKSRGGIGSERDATTVNRLVEKRKRQCSFTPPKILRRSGGGPSIDKPSRRPPAISSPLLRHPEKKHPTLPPTTFFLSPPSPFIPLIDKERTEREVNTKNNRKKSNFEGGPSSPKS